MSFKEVTSWYSISAFILVVILIYWGIDTYATKVKLLYLFRLLNCYLYCVVRYMISVFYTHTSIMLMNWTAWQQTCNRIMCLYPTQPTHWSLKCCCLSHPMWLSSPPFIPQSYLLTLTLFSRPAVRPSAASGTLSDSSATQRVSVAVIDFSTIFG